MHRRRHCCHDTSEPDADLRERRAVGALPETARRRRLRDRLGERAVDEAERQRRDGRAVLVGSRAVLVGTHRQAHRGHSLDDRRHTRDGRRRRPLHLRSGRARHRNTGGPGVELGEFVVGVVVGEFGEGGGPRRRRGAVRREVAMPRCSS